MLLALWRWGSPLTPRPDSADELSPDALVTALLTTFDPAAALGLAGTLRLDLPTDAFMISVHDGRLDVARGEASADATLAGSVRTIQDLVFDQHPLDEATRSGDARAEGNTTLLKHFLVLFDEHRAC